jgi:putative peptide zinc metalloprotease protein
LEKILVEPGQHVAKGQPLAELKSPEIDLELSDLAGQVARYRRQLENLAWQRHRDPQAGGQIPAIREALKSVEDQLARKQEDRRRLELSAPAAGTVFPPPSVPKPREPEDELTTWSGTPLERENLGCYLEEGQLLCQVGDPARMEAILVIDQADIEFVRKGQPVEIRLEALPHQTFTYNPLGGRKVRLAIEEVARSDLKISPARLSAKGGGELPTRTDAAGREHPLTTSYQARVPLDAPAGALLPGLCGQAKIQVGTQPLGARLYRWVARTVNFRL